MLCRGGLAHHVRALRPPTNNSFAESLYGLIERVTFFNEENGFAILQVKVSMSLFKGTKDYEVVVDFDRWAADLVRGRRWHASQTIAELPKGQMRMSMRFNSIEEAERWVLGWGIHATVVRPKALAKRMRTTSRHLRDRYENLLTDPPSAGDSK